MPENPALYCRDLVRCRRGSAVPRRRPPVPRESRPAPAPQAGRLHDAFQNQLVLNYLDLAESLAARFAARGRERSDLVQVAYLGLVKAARGFDEEKGESFPAYAAPPSAANSSGSCGTAAGPSGRRGASRTCGRSCSAPPPTWPRRWAAFPRRRNWPANWASARMTSGRRRRAASSMHPDSLDSRRSLGRPDDGGGAGLAGPADRAPGRARRACTRQSRSWTLTTGRCCTGGTSARRRRWNSANGSASRRCRCRGGWPESWSGCSAGCWRSEASGPGCSPQPGGGEGTISATVTRQTTRRVRSWPRRCHRGAPERRSAPRAGPGGGPQTSAGAGPKSTTEGREYAEARWAAPVSAETTSRASAMQATNSASRSCPARTAFREPGGPCNIQRPRPFRGAAGEHHPVAIR